MNETSLRYTIAWQSSRDSVVDLFEFCVPGLQLAILFAATRLVLLTSLVPNLLVAALRLMAEVLCLLMVVF